MNKTTKTKVTEPATPAPEAEPEKLTPKEAQQVKVIERVIENREIAPADAFGKLTRPQVELIKRTIAVGASDDELRLFIQVCKGSKLNPFLRQVHLVPFWDSKTGTERRVIIVGIDGFRSIAEDSGAYAGNDDPVHEGEKQVKIKVWENKQQVDKEMTAPEKSTVTVWKMVEGQRFPFTATARWEEYYPGERKGGNWHRMPYLQLGKCAEALALRKAFPKLLSGMYEQGEMDRVVQVDESAKKQKAANDYISQVIKRADPKELEETKQLIIKSDKYTDEQKQEFLAAVEARLVELKGNPL